MTKEATARNDKGTSLNSRVIYAKSATAENRPRCRTFC